MAPADVVIAALVVLVRDGLDQDPIESLAGKINVCWHDKTRLGVMPAV